MLKKFQPTWTLEAIYQLTPAQLKANQIQAVFTDLDNTLIAWNNPDGTPELKRWLNQMAEAEIPVIVVSNNKAERVARAVEAFGVDFVARALKPTSKGYQEALKKFALNKADVVMVGDQLMTDILGANLAGIRSILVRPIVETDAWNTKLNRALERKIVKRLTKNQGMEWKKTL